MASTDGQTVRQVPRGKVKINRPRSIARSLIEFQPDAVEIEKRSVPGRARWTLYTVVALMVATVAWAYWAQVDRIVVARGSLVTTAPTIVVQPLSSAKIDQILVQFGDIVRPNQVLATLDRTLSEADVAIYRAKEKSLRANLVRLTAERDGLEFELGPDQTSDVWQAQLRAFIDRRHEYDAKVATFAAEHEKIVSKQAANKEKIERVKFELDIRQKLFQKQESLQAKDSISEIELWSAQVELQKTEQLLAEAESEREQLKQDLKVNEKGQAEYIAHRNAEVSTDYLKVQSDLDQAVEELNKANYLDTQVDLRVPSDLGHDAYFVQEVAERPVIAKPTEAMFKLVPLDVGAQGLEAEVEIETRDTGLLQGNESVRIKIDAFPYQKHGTLNGTLKTISEGTFKKGEGPTSKMIYKGRVALGGTETLKNMPKNFRLLPGSSISAEIKVGKRRVIEYFLYPLLRYLDDSVKEP